jgi:acetyl esterase/lipase
VRTFLAALVLFGCATTKAPLRDERGIAALTRRADFSSVTISPDGAYLAMAAFDGRVSKLAFMRTSDLQFEGGHALAAPLVIRRVVWANNTRVAIELGTQSGTLDVPVGTGEIMAVDADGSSPKLIFSYRAGEMQTGSHLRKQQAIFAYGTIMGRLPSDERKILVKAQSWSESGRDIGMGEVYAVDVYTGVHDKVVSGPGAVASYLTDEKGDVRFAIGLGKGGVYELFWRDEGSWRQLDAAPENLPLGWSASARTMYVVDDRAKAIVSISLDSGERKVVSQKAGGHPRRVLFDPERGTPIAVEYELDYPHWEIVDDSHALAKSLASLKTQYPRHHVRITSMTSNGAKAVALVYSDRTPGVYHLLEGADAKALFASRDGIDSGSLGSMEAFKIEASDGLQLHGYLTLPPGKGDRNLPMVVMPHGGPHDSYDEWGFDPIAQIFARSGMAVLQVNFRGSDGYGREFEEAGYLKWGDRIQDDIIEATRWAIQEGVADAKRVCIFGGSFGGYSAVQSSIRAPDLYRCAVGFAGVYDLPDLFVEGDLRETIWGRGRLAVYLGEDKEAMKKASPVYRASEIRVPVLLIHGDEDPRAPISQAKALAEALRTQGKPVETMFVADEGHGFWDEANRLSAYQRALEFIEAHVGSR